MRLIYRNSEVHERQAPATGIASIAHVFNDADSPYVFAFCEMADGSTFWCNKTEDKCQAPLGLMFGMQPAGPWIAALTHIPQNMRIAALIGRPQKGGAA